MLKIFSVGWIAVLTLTWSKGAWAQSCPTSFASPGSNGGPSPAIGPTSDGPVGADVSLNGGTSPLGGEGLGSSAPTTADSTIGLDNSTDDDGPGVGLSGIGPEGQGPVADAPPPPAPPPSPAPHGGGVCNPDALLNVGDPVHTYFGNSSRQFEDGFLWDPVANLRFSRFYTSNDNVWGTTSATASLPTQFGTSPTNANSIRWWHNFFGVITAYPLTPVEVNEPNGHFSVFNDCNTTQPCWATNGNAGSVRDRLLQTSNGYVFFKEGEGRYVYSSYYLRNGETTPSKWLLSQIQDEQGTPVATVNYAQPADPQCPVTADGGTPGAPFIGSVVSASGNQLNFHYKALEALSGRSGPECVLDYVGLVDKGNGGTESSIATYTYTTGTLSDGGMGEQPGMLASVALPSRTETYTYPTNELKISKAGSVVVDHHYGATAPSALGVASSVGMYESLSFNYGATNNVACLSGSNCCGWTATSNWAKDNFAGLGNGNTGFAGFKRTYLALEDVGQFGDERLYQYTDSCTTANSCSPGNVRIEMSCSGTDPNYGTPVPGEVQAIKDKRNNWTAFSYDAGTPAFPQLWEKTSKMAGATGINGTSALETTNYGYTYGTNSEQMVDHEDQSSLLGGTGTTESTKYIYDTSTNRTKAVIRHGWTQVLNGTSWTTQERYIGTFYFTNHACLADAQDTLNRTQEIHGPCLVSGYGATDCDVSTSAGVPIEQYFYYPASTTSNTSNRVQTRSLITSNTGPTSCSGKPTLSTTYNSYDARGNVTSMTDPNSVTTTFTYEAARATSKTVAGHTTNYTYDNGKLTAIQHPQGNYSVYCYRSGTTGGCTGGTWTEHLQWKAKSSSASGATWSEKVNFAYWSNGQVSSKTYLDGSGNVRKVMKFASDAHARPTWKQWGDAAGQFSNTQYFDAANNLSGVGNAYNSPPAYCGGPKSNGTPQSALCAGLAYDRADRLFGLDTFPTAAGSATRTCFVYNAQGSVSASKMGCTATATAGDCSSCTQTAATYQYDDFGNVVAATLPWTSNGGGGSGTTHFEFDAKGLMVNKQTPQMSSNGEHLSYAYDILGRTLSLQHIYTSPSSGSETLFSMDYDNTLTIDSSCPASTNTLGRLLHRQDSFGDTWYQYDSWGNVTAQTRLRSGTTSCGAGTADVNPSTLYAYSNNGDLTSITYPYGRTVTYGYGTGALADRVSTTSITTFDGTSWSAANVISQVAWEPFGGLRGYQINHPNSSAISSVEYVLGDNGSLPPSANSCPTSIPSSASSDHTGRLRALWVSSGTFSPGSGNGSIYKKLYTWTADQVNQTDTCLLTGTVPKTENYVYDGKTQLTQATRPAGNFAASGGAFGSRSYGYSTRGNRSTQTNEDCGYGATFPSTSADQLTGQSSSCTGAILKHSLAYDNDGRATSKTWANDSTGPAWALTFSSGASGTSSNGALDSVFKSISVNGATYNYFYDSLNHRRLKVYPTGAKDEYFSSDGSQMLVDRGNDSIATPSNYTEDDYVWLEGRPVTLVRGKWNSSWVRQSDSTVDCKRNGDAASCGFYFPITDVINKPVAMLDGSGKLAGTGDYDPFGHVNRVTLDAETAHPYANSTSATLADFTQPIGGTANPSTAVDVRVLFNLVDTESNAGTSLDYAYLLDANTSTALTGNIGGNHAGQVWTSWVTPSTGHVQVPFVSSTQNCCPDGSGGLNCGGGCTQFPSYPYTGVVMEGYEYRRHQTGAATFWTPLRFPGQYYDAESDLFQNWNRFYDPSLGRYLESEPMMVSSSWVKGKALSGTTPPVYGYANNNPARYVDSDGRDFVIDDAAFAAAAAAAAAAALASSIHNAWENSKDAIGALCAKKKDESCRCKCFRPGQLYTDFLRVDSPNVCAQMCSSLPGGNWGSECK